MLAFGLLFLFSAKLFGVDAVLTPGYCSINSKEEIVSSALPHYGYLNNSTDMSWSTSDVQSLVYFDVKGLKKMNLKVELTRTSGFPSGLGMQIYGIHGSTLTSFFACPLDQIVTTDPLVFKFKLPQTGTYRVRIGAFIKGETGTYAVSFNGVYPKDLKIRDADAYNLGLLKSVQGSLKITSTSILSLNFPVLEKVDKEVIVKGNDKLASLAMSKLSTTSSITIQNNPQLVTLLLDSVTESKITAHQVSICQNNAGLELSQGLVSNIGTHSGNVCEKPQGDCSC